MTAALDAYNNQIKEFKNISEAKEWFLSIGDSLAIQNSDSLKVPKNFVRGCCPHCQVWCDGSLKGNTWNFRAYSSNNQIRSLCKILMDTYNNLNEKQIKDIKYKNFHNITRLLDQDKQKSLQHLINRVQKIVAENS